MAQLQTTPVNGKRNKAQPLIDMTPMVDLGFLLITFFIFTSALEEPHTLHLLMPDAKGKPHPLKQSHAITAELTGNGNVIAYEGFFEEAKKPAGLVYTNLDVQTGLGAFIRKKQTAMGADRDKLVYIIKPAKEASYKDVVNALDEAAINGIEKFVLTEKN